MSSRRYSSDRRAAGALETRRRILTAAEQELRAAGYHAMTVAGLARRAGVSPQTIYNTLGSKAAVVKGLYDVRLAGDDAPIPIRERPEFRAVLERPDAESMLRGYLHLGRTLYARVGELLGILLAEGPGADAELGRFVSTIEGERRAGNDGILTTIEARFGPGATRSGPAAVDVLWTLTCYEVADRLVRRCGWSLDAYEEWLADTAVAGILGPG